MPIRDDAQGEPLATAGRPVGRAVPGFVMLLVRMLVDADSRPPFVGISQMGAVPGSKIPLFDIGGE
jgi:hypothetical protein